MFVVGCLGDWRRAASVLFESESLSGHPAPSREKRQRVAPTITTGAPFSRTGNASVETVGNEIASTLTATNYKGVQAVTYALPGNWIGRKPENGGNQVEPFVELSPCQTATDVHAVAFQPTADCLTAAYATKWNGNASATNGSLFAAQSSAVRRLTPTECERLQGFPDDYTQIPWRGKEPEDCPNGHRYKAMGNSMAVPVMKWIGERIKMVEEEKL